MFILKQSFTSLYKRTFIPVLENQLAEVDSLICGTKMNLKVILLNETPLPIQATQQVKTKNVTLYCKIVIPFSYKHADKSTTMEKYGRLYWYSCT